MMRQVAVPILLAALVLGACSEPTGGGGESLQGNGDIVTENRPVSSFDAVRAGNGVRVVLAVDATSSGDVVLAVTTDSNLQEFITTRVDGSTLKVSTDRHGGVAPTGAFDVSGTVAALEEVSANDGARIEITGSLGDLSLSASNGASVGSGDLEAATITVDISNGAQATVCATEAVDGKVTNGGRLTVRCGGNVDGVETTGGGAVSPEG